MAWTLRRRRESERTRRKGDIGDKGEREVRGLPVEGTRDDEQLVGVLLGEAGVELAVVDEAAGLADDEECVDDPGESVSASSSMRWWS